MDVGEPADGPAEVLAAGGVILRATPAGGHEVALVHRPKYDDWSFPKGKLEPGESEPDAARREVEEETGFVCTLGEELATVRYIDGRGRRKQVRYWMMTIAGGALATPNAEVDELRWCATTDAGTLLTYQHDRAVARRLGVM